MEIAPAHRRVLQRRLRVAGHGGGSGPVHGLLRGYTKSKALEDSVYYDQRHQSCGDLRQAAPDYRILCSDNLLLQRALARLPFLVPNGRTEAASSSSGALGPVAAATNAEIASSSLIPVNSRIGRVFAFRLSSSLTVHLFGLIAME